MSDWYTISDVESLDTPALVLYPDRIRENIRVVKSILPDTSRLRPHVKTHKSSDVTQLLLEAGVTKFKCATIAEAEMLAQAGAPDVLLAYQPVGPKAVRLHLLVEKYPNTIFSCIIDSAETASHLSDIFQNAGKVANVFIDLNVGMNRTGILPEKALDLYHACQSLKGLRIVGLHAYDGHIRDADYVLRTKRCGEAFTRVQVLREEIMKIHEGEFTVVAGGTPTFPIHAGRADTECSPGTFIYWDIGYQKILTEQPYLIGALVITRIISKPTADTVCIDLGHKSIASENPIDQRVIFLNAPGLLPVGHSEEHMVLKSQPYNHYQVGDVLYGVPFHICPTCALYDLAAVVENNRVASQWNILSRKRSITL